ncbi:hypothetical protein [Actinoplanes subglobosus]|uniref:Uncharacterized protein n=1 Tax=Actinoplanes subglobosus TaxID=1547892 RepID=A0ABV8IWM4_9ACTN
MSESNCGAAEAEAYPIASLWVMHHNRPQVMREWMFYSPLCDTFWGQVEHHYGGWDIPLQMWRQPEYGGRNVLAYGAVHVGSIEVEDTLETRMVSAKKGAVKFCVGGLDQDPDTEPENQEYSDYQTEDCTTFR